MCHTLLRRVRGEPEAISGCMYVCVAETARKKQFSKVGPLGERKSALGGQLAAPGLRQEQGEELLGRKEEQFV